MGRVSHSPTTVADVSSKHWEEMIQLDNILFDIP